jgi:hypothetical protein
MARNIKNVDYDSLTITDTATSFTAALDNLTAIPTGAKSFVGIIESADIRVRDDGTAATSAEGVLYVNGSEVVFDESEFGASLIRAAGTNATIRGHFVNVEASVLMGAN